MTRNLLSLAGFLLLSAATVSAAEPTVDLSAKTAARLIGMKADTPENSIEISFILDGTSKCGDFEAKHVRRVAAIHPVREEASQRRKVVFYDVFWNESLGWFMWQDGAERAGEVVYLWSELKGEIVNK